MDKQRARSAKDKAYRHEVIVTKTGRALERERVDQITISGIAKATGLGNATLYTYFAGKEDILLAVFERELYLLADEICAQLPGATNPASAARILVDAVVGRLVYRRLAVVLHTQLEPRVSPQRREAFRALLVAELTRVGVAVEERLQALSPGGGVAALRRFHALALGLHQLRDRSGKMIGGDTDFASEMYDSLTAVLRGMTKGDANE